MRIASISKPMCASLVARLVQDGKMQWDDSIYKFLPDFPPKKFDGQPCGHHDPPTAIAYRRHSTLPREGRPTKC
ncbi:Beta-lactamase domain-containing protein [Aphelenchoides fujianensis]|nr:Beta-lactamase domain-containing protein [Aphelenchoides fujianensis]